MNIRKSAADLVKALKGTHTPNQPRASADEVRRQLRQGQQTEGHRQRSNAPRKPSLVLSGSEFQFDET